jgi:hypothetical protein
MRERANGTKPRTRKIRNQRFAGDSGDPGDVAGVDKPGTLTDRQPIA